MNFLELKKEIIDLGFEEDSVMTDTEYNRKIVSASNRAIDEINTTVVPLVKCVTVEGSQSYDMNEIVSDFVDFYGKPKMTENGERKTFNDFSVEGKAKIVSRGYTGQLDIYYKAYPTRITLGTADDFEIELDKLVLPLVPLLAAYYLWLDDDERKAAMYYNNYDSLKQSILINRVNPMTASIRGGISWLR